jgi:zinc-ribbon domain
MYCPNCGHQNESNASFCIKCGKPLANTKQQSQDVPTPASVPSLEPGRGGLILTLGILSVVLLGPILGIPSWVMGHRDLKKIRAGIILPSQRGLTQSGMVLGIIGTFVSTFSIIIIGIALAVGISMFKSNAQSSNRDQVINDLNNLAAKAQQYYRKPKVMGGGSESFRGFSLSDRDASNANGDYQISNEIPAVSYYDPTAKQTASNTSSVVIVGWGEEIGNDGIHKIEACVTVTKAGALTSVIN